MIKDEDFYKLVDFLIKEKSLRRFVSSFHTANSMIEGLGIVNSIESIIAGSHESIFYSPFEWDYISYWNSINNKWKQYIQDNKIVSVSHEYDNFPSPKLTKACYFLMFMYKNNILKGFTTQRDNGYFGGNIRQTSHEISKLDKELSRIWSKRFLDNSGDGIQQEVLDAKEY